MAAAQDPSDEWSLLAPSYHDVLLPRFQPLYDTMATFAVERIQSRHLGQPSRVLDYGTGPGEPILTILQQLTAKKIEHVELCATDSSTRMLLLAESRLKDIRHQDRTVHFCSFDQCSQPNTYAVITSSLVLPYASSKAQMLQELSALLIPGGLLINSHWPHASQVPFLTILKRVSVFMVNGTRIDASSLESDVSFSCWPEETTREIFASQGFTIEHWLTVPLPMSFPNIRALLSFCQVASWFDKPDLYSKAEAEVRRILHGDYQLAVQGDQPFQLPSNVVVVVASKN